MKEENPYAKIRRVALNLLTRRDYSEHTISKKLQQKGYAAIEIQTVVAELVENNFLNDKRFAENYIHSRCNKGYGPNRILLELKSLGIADDIIAEQLNIADNTWLDHAIRVWQKKFKGRKASDLKEQFKQKQYLQYRGFSAEIIEDIVGAAD